MTSKTYSFKLHAYDRVNTSRGGGLKGLIQSLPVRCDLQCKGKFAKINFVTLHAAFIMCK